VFSRARVGGTLPQDGVDAIQPFAYLTCNEGPTSHWFLGPISALRPKPVLRALREAFAPFGVSIELWDRHFYPDEKRAVRIFLFNDRPERTSRKTPCRCAPSLRPVGVAAGDQAVRARVVNQKGAGCGPHATCYGRVSHLR